VAEKKIADEKVVAEKAVAASETSAAESKAIVLSSPQATKADEIASPGTSTSTTMGAAYNADVKAALTKIEGEHGAIDASFQQCDAAGTMPAAAKDTFEYQVQDAIGVLYGGQREAEAQLAGVAAAELGTNRGFSKEAKAERKARMAVLKANIADFAAKLEQCRMLYMDELKIPLDMLPANLPTLKTSMPVAATSTGDSMQRLLGRLWLINQKAAAGDDKKLQQLVAKKLTTALGKYDAARTVATGVFVPLARCSVFARDFALEDAIGSHVCWLEASMVLGAPWYSMPLACPQHSYRFHHLYVLR